MRTGAPITEAIDPRQWPAGTIGNAVLQGNLVMLVESESWLRRFIILGGATLLGLLSASVALAGPTDWRTQVRDHADNVNYVSREVRQELVHVASHSCLFGQMMVEVGRMETNAAILRGWSRHQSPLQLESKVHELSANSDRLQALIQEAWLRGQRGVHRPLGCTQRLRGMMTQVDAEIMAAYQKIPGVRTVYSAPHPCDHWGGGGFQSVQRPQYQPQYVPQYPRDARHSHDSVQFEVNIGNGIRISNQSRSQGSAGVQFFDNGPRIAQDLASAVRLGGLQIGSDHRDGRHSVGRRHGDHGGYRR
jgi:hypothetical protein